MHVASAAAHHASLVTSSSQHPMMGRFAWPRVMSTAITIAEGNSRAPAWCHMVWQGCAALSLASPVACEPARSSAPPTYTQATSGRTAALLALRLDRGVPSWYTGMPTVSLAWSGAGLDLDLTITVAVVPGSGSSSSRLLPSFSIPSASVAICMTVKASMLRRDRSAPQHMPVWQTWHKRDCWRALYDRQPTSLLLTHVCWPCRQVACHISSCKCARDGIGACMGPHVLAPV